MTSDAQLQLAEVELVDVSVDDVQLVAPETSTGVREIQVPAPSPAAIAERYLAAEADGIAARASTAGTRRQYASIYRSFATCGKTHIATALGVRASLAGQRVQFATATQWVARLADAKRQGQLEAELRRLSFVPLVIIDEVG